MTPDWERCRRFIEDGLQHDAGERTIDEVAAFILADEAQFWPGARCAVVTEWFHFPRFKALNIWLMGGDLRELCGPVLERIAAYATDNGARQLFGGAYDRPGWGRALQASGFEPRWTVFSKDLAE
jgi:hypothetical protein